MPIKNILIPLDEIDEKERILHILDFIETSFSKEEITLTLMNVQVLIPITGYNYEDELYNATKKSERILEIAKHLFKDYNFKTYFTIGNPSKEIIQRSKEDNIELIIISKTNKKGINRIIGSVASQVIKNSECLVIIVP